ncbi:MAG: cytochrome b/b6 domain-containing protein [Planctomycetes bacterium]|nr:cytochrome b/b6 domain-containing protein [Planctomycetota bacterium]
MALWVVLRIFWGICGSRYARFAEFAYGPAAVLEYAQAALRGGGRRYIGHNPGSAYAIFAMLVLMLGLAATGFMMGRGTKGVKETHEILAYVMAGVVIVHLAGVALHTIRHRENITASMIHGKKQAEPQEGIRGDRPMVAILFLGISTAWTIGLVRNFDPGTRSVRLPLIGTALQIGEAESDEDPGSEQAEHERDGDD